MNLDPKSPWHFLASLRLHGAYSRPIRIRLRIDDYGAFNQFAVEKSNKFCNGLHAILPHIIEVNPKLSPSFSRWKEKKLTHRDEKFASCLLSVSGGIGGS